MKTLKYMSSLLLMVAISFIACDREENLTFNDFDQNNDGLIQKSEFVDVFTANYYDDWNLTDDEYLDDEDFHTTVYHMWDVDDDMMLTRDEWTGGYDYYYGNYVVVDYEEIDVDADGLISFDEYNDWAYDTHFYADWDYDADTFLSEEELAKGVFENWDVDNSQAIERDEYNDFDMYYLDI